MATAALARPTLAKKFTIRVPATSANIGPGFDVVGLSLSLYLTLEVTVATSSHSTSTPGSGSASASYRCLPSSSHSSSKSNALTPPAYDYPILTYTGEGSSEVPLDPYKNLITRVALYVLRCHSIPRIPSGTHIHCHNEIPLGRGLGSSGAAVAAGVLLADHLAPTACTPCPSTPGSGLSLSLSRKLDFALMVERHPDNVAAALVGGFVGSYLRELEPAAREAASVPLSEVLPEFPPDAGPDWGTDPPPPEPPRGIGHFVKFAWNNSIMAIVIVPSFELSTAKARAVLPELYTRQDVVFNLQRLAVLTTALAQEPPDPYLIYEAMQDRLHQPYRRSLVPGLPEVTSRIRPDTHPGLLGICLSGAGPTILALATDGFEAIVEDTRDIFLRHGISIDWKVLNVVGGSTVQHHQIDFTLS